MGAQVSQSYVSLGRGCSPVVVDTPPLVVWTPSPLVGMGTLGWVSRRGSIGLGAVAVESAGVSARGSAALTLGRSTVLAGDGGVVGEPHGWPPFS